MSKAEYPVTQAVRFLRSNKIDFVPYIYAYEEHGGTARFAECAGKPEHQVIKTIVLQDEHKKGLVVLMHGDKHISTRNLARELGLKHIEPATADQAAKWTGYLVGGTSPFGMKTALPVYVEESIWWKRGGIVRYSEKGFTAFFRYRLGETSASRCYHHGWKRSLGKGEGHAPNGGA